MGRTRQFSPRSPIRDAWVKVIDRPVLLEAIHTCTDHLYPSLFPNRIASNKSGSSIIEVSDTEMIKFREVKASLFDVNFEKYILRRFLIPWYLQ